MQELNPQPQIKPYDPGKEELGVQSYLIKRLAVLKESKKQILDGINFENIMREADREYQPRFLGEKETRSVNLIHDELLGLRGGTLTPIGQEGAEWRSDVSEPTLMVKIQTALSILIDRNPEAVFKAMTQKYKARTSLASALWKRSWNVARSKHQLKLIVFDMAKYGWAVGRTYNRVEKRDKEILDQYDAVNPEKNKFRKVKITEYNDIYRERLDPYRTWIDDMTNLADPLSMDDWYHEKDYPYDTFMRLYGDYANADMVRQGLVSGDITGNDPLKLSGRDDLVTVGCYESKNKDLYALWIPAQNIVLYYSPLPNDQGKLSCWWTYWNLRDPRTPYGIGLFEIIKHSKVLYDRLANMTIDQLVMAIYPMLFYSGSNEMEDITITPALIKQKAPGTTVEQVQVNYDPRGWEGVAQVREMMDESTGITPTLQGETQTGKTLGEVLHAKDAALKRLNVPLDNIAQMLQEEAYISLSWMNQIYSVPEVMEFSSMEDYQRYINETGRDPSQERMMANGGVSADFYPVLDLGLDDREGSLVESPEDRFFQVGKDIQPGDIEWEGIVVIEPQSILAPSKELEKQRKTELFNLLAPITQGMAAAMNMGDFLTVAANMKPLKQVLEIHDEEPRHWIFDEAMQFDENPEMFKQQFAMQQQAQQPLFVDQVQQGTQPQSPKTQAQGNSVVPRNQVANPERKLLGGIDKKGAGQMYNRPI